MRTPMRRSVIFLMLVIVGCSGKDSGSSAPAAAAGTPAPVAIPDGPGAPQAALRAYSAAVASGDGRGVWSGSPAQTHEQAIQRWTSELADLRTKGSVAQQ